MNIYHFDPITHELLGSSIADESPLEPGVFLTPAFATKEPPPDVPAGHAAVFDGGAWSLMIDKRGTRYWRADVEYTMCELGELPAGATLTVPAPARSEVLTAAWQKIKALRDYRADQGGYKVGAHWFHSDQKSRAQQLGLAQLGADIAADLKWKTMDGSFVAMTPALAKQVLAAAAASDQATFAAAEAHRAALEKAADPAAYNFSTGWPPIFGE